MGESIFGTPFWALGWFDIWDCGEARIGIDTPSTPCTFQGHLEKWKGDRTTESICMLLAKKQDLN